eukprot:jgi/Chrzof1/12343/Cz06g31070.t1
MPLLNFLAGAAAKAGNALRKVGDVGSSALRNFGAPIAGALRPLASTVGSMVGASPAGSLLSGLVSKGLDYVASGKAADAVGKLSGLGTKLSAASASLHPT